jgi:hypothetical protein
LIHFTNLNDFLLASEPIAYLDAAIEAGDPQLFAIALHNVTQAQEGAMPFVEPAIGSERTDIPNGDIPQISCGLLPNRGY